MEREPVVDSMISEVGYNPACRTLEILFESGAIYLFYFIPEDVHRALMNAEHKGDYWAQHIKQVYDYHRIAEPYEMPKRRRPAPRR